MATHDYTRQSSALTVAAGTDHTFTTDTFTVPTGEQFKQFKVLNPNNNSSDIQMRGKAKETFGSSGWGTWSSKKSALSWSNGTGASVKVHNGGSNYSMRIQVVFQTEDLPYTKVTAGNKIMASDINQTGTSISAGTVMQNSNFSNGTAAQASTFNTKVLGM